MTGSSQVRKVGLRRAKKSARTEGRLSLRDVLEAIQNGPTPQNEETAKFQIIAPVLQGLGWNPFSGTEVLFEHRVETAKGSGRVDIALQHQGHTVAHIEAKAPCHDLSRFAKQAVGYGFDEGVDICALTTGLEWQLYLPRANRPHTERLFATLRLEHDRIDQLAEDLETFLGKESLLNGRSERRATEVLEARRQADLLKNKLPEIWSRMVREPDERLVELVVGQAYEKLNLRPTGEQVKAVLRGSPVPTVTAPEPAQSSTRPQQQKRQSQDQQTKPRSRKKATKIAAYELWGERHEVTTWNAMLVGVAESLHRRHGHSFDRILTVRGRKYPHASRDPDELAASPKVVGSSGIYIETHGSAEQLRQQAAKFLKLFGHPAEDLRIETQTN